MLKDKVIVITGASRGLGKALAVALSAKGAKVVVSARNQDELAQTAKDAKALAVVGDVTKENDMIHLADEAVAKFGRIDIWINNAGVWMPPAAIEDVDMKKAHELIEVNLFGTMNGCRATLPAMKKQGQGIVVNIISTAALLLRPLQSIYSASKQAERGFTNVFREDVKASGIKVIGVYPGGFKSNLFEAHRPSDFADFMPAESVADRIIENLESDNPLEEQILKRPGQ